MATATFEPLAVPLREDEHGAIRVADSRVLLDLVIQEFRTGATPEEIVASYDALRLADVYAVIGYYLRHTQEVDAYLTRRAHEAEDLRQMIESSQPPRSSLRAALMARAQTRAKTDDPSP
jgi:uncharacterized protein (DUF433 family)